MFSTWLSVAALAVGAQSACDSQNLENQAPRLSERERKVRDEREVWFQKQVQQDCPPLPYDVAAMEAVWRAYRGAFQPVFGPPDPSGRRGASPSLRTRPNPRGEGVIVTTWKDHNREGMADYSRERLVWLVLGGTVYPVHIDSARALGRLFDGMPEDVQNRAGLRHTFERGQTMLDQLGIEERTYVRRFEGGKPFPHCREPQARVEAEKR